MRFSSCYKGLIGGSVTAETGNSCRLNIQLLYRIELFNHRPPCLNYRSPVSVDRGVICWSHGLIEPPRRVRDAHPPVDGVTFCPLANAGRSSRIFPPWLMDCSANFFTRETFSISSISVVRKVVLLGETCAFTLWIIFYPNTNTESDIGLFVFI